MNIRKTLIFALIALPSLLLQSCLKDDDEIFDGSPSERIDSYLSDAQKALINSSEGWVLDYYPQSAQSYGGFAYTVKFSKDTATVRFENYVDQGEAKSLYSMKKNDGPVLSFDNYNAFMHYFATPTSEMVEGYNGDFEFVIDSIGEDVVKVHGVRNHNTMYFRKLNEPAANYMNKVVNMSDLFQLIGADLSIGGQSVQADFNRGSRQVTFTYNGQTVQSAYTVTDKGIRLYKPVDINGVTVWELAYNDDNLTLTADGVTTEKGYYDPATITNAIGGIGANDDAFSRTIRGLMHLDQFEVESAQDWLTVTSDPANGSITVSADANNTGSMRPGTVVVKNGRYSSTFSVTQSELKDLLGNYIFQYQDYNMKTQQAMATLSQGKNGIEFKFELSDGVQITMPATYDQATGALMFSQLNMVGALQTRSGGTYYLFNAYDLTGQGGFIFNPNVNMAVYFQYNATYGTIARFGTGEALFGGQDIGYAIHGVMLMASSTPQPTGSEDFAGYWDIIQNGILVKAGAGGAKANITLK